MTVWEILSVDVLSKYKLIQSIWMKLKMILPFISKEKKTIWNLKLNLDRIDIALNEKDPQHFLGEIRDLYPRLRKYENIYMPMIEPFNTGIEEYDSTWYGYHFTFLKCLHRDVRNDKFNLDQWNVDVKREAAKRAAVLAWRM